MSPSGYYFTEPGFVPFVVTDTIATFRCRIPVVPGGDGAEDVPLEQRTARCGHLAPFLVGAAPTCRHHLTVAFRIGGIKPPPFDDRCES